MRFSRLALGLIVAGCWSVGTLGASDLPATTSPSVCQAGAEVAVPARELPPEPTFLLGNVWCCNPPTINCDQMPRTDCVAAGGSWFNSAGKCFLVC
jgi:hypothetical protein